MVQRLRLPDSRYLRSDAGESDATRDERAVNRDRIPTFTMSRRLDGLERVIVSICCLAASSDEIDALQVVTPRQPAYRELMRYRTVAEAHGCTMTVKRSAAGLTLRFHAAHKTLSPQDGRQPI